MRCWVWGLGGWVGGWVGGWSYRCLEESLPFVGHGVALEHRLKRKEEAIGEEMGVHEGGVRHGQVARLCGWVGGWVGGRMGCMLLWLSNEVLRVMGEWVGGEIGGGRRRWVCT